MSVLPTRTDGNSPIASIPAAKAFGPFAAIASLPRPSMARFNALTSTLDTPAERPKSAPRKKVKSPPASAPAPQPVPAKAPSAKAPAAETPLSRHACRVPVATFAALLATADKRKADAERTAFAAWCAARPALALDWRAAWSAYHTKAAPAATVAPAKSVATAKPISTSPARRFLSTL